MRLSAKLGHAENGLEELNDVFLLHQLVKSIIKF